VWVRNLPEGVGGHAVRQPESRLQNAVAMKTDDVDKPVTILVPTGKDGPAVSNILAKMGIGSQAAANLEDLVRTLDDAGGAIIAEQVLLQPSSGVLADWAKQQPPWSDFPFIVLIDRNGASDERLSQMLGNVTLLERPLRPGTLVSAVRSALRARRRQREAQAYLEERKQTAARQTLLIRELHHRVKNTLATVQALVGATVRSTTTVEEFYRAFSARVVSLANTHSLLTEDYWQTASLREMLTNELGPYDDDAGRVVLNGPLVELSSDLAVPTGMAIHELTTNAAKFGALSVPTGRVEVAWNIERQDNSRKLRLEWVERGGPPVEPPQRKGFGSTLLQRVLTAQAQAEIHIDFEKAGLRFKMDAPLIEHRQVPHY
jgi:two-component sensor histidine kinase